MRASALLALYLAVLPSSGCYELKDADDTADLAVPLDGRTDLAPLADAAATTDGACWDPAGFNGRGCFRCPPTSRDEILNSCHTSSQCVSFATPLPLGDGGLPRLPTRDLAPPPDLAPAVDARPPDLLPPPADGPMLPACASLPNVVYVTGSTAVAPFLGAVAQRLENAVPPVTVVYQSSGSCVGISAIVAPLSARMSGTATFWDPNLGIDPNSAQARLSCRLDPSGNAADVGLSDVFATTCLELPGGLDPSIKDTFGPVQTMNMVVPQNSSERSISAEAAYLVWGFGGTTYPVPPWTDPNYLFQRNVSSGTQAQIARTLGLPRDAWFGRMNAGSGNVRDALIASGAAGQEVASKSLGILGSDVADGARSSIRGLAFQDYRQTCAFWPDSRVDATDKRSVRDGHYSIFGPLHMLTRVDRNGVATSPGAQALIDAIAGVTPLPGVNVIDLYARSGLVPQCAMRVTRDSDGGDLRRFTPAVSCACYYEERATGLVPPPGCTPCTGTQDCPPGVPCNVFGGQARGYCEP